MPSAGAGGSRSTGDAGPSESPRVHLVIVTDPGPDPDDVKTILSSAIKHRRGQIRVHGVVCNGGHQAEQRARLAKALLKYLRCDDIPVAIGSSGKPYDPKPHEYAFPGVEHVQASELREGNELLLELLQRAAPHSLTFLMISAMTDLANVMRDQPELVQQKVRHICVMGGLQRREAAAAPPDSDGGAASGDDSGDSGGGGWEPDTAVNNGWDAESAELMYSFCLAHGVPMSVVSRNAVPNLPMSIAKDFATSEPKDPVMKYLVDAQELGLIGLWKRICSNDGSMPPRCSKQWYFNTFCAVDAATFEARSYDELGATAQIRDYLNGHVKPYDVCALVLALEEEAAGSNLSPELVEEKGATHRLYLESANTVSLDAVTRLLSSIFEEVVELGRSFNRQTPDANGGGGGGSSAGGGEASS